MKVHSIVLTGVMLAGTVALAQTAATPKKSVSQAHAAGIAVDHPGGNTPKANPAASGTNGQAAEKPKVTPPPKKHLGNVKYNNRVTSSGSGAAAPVAAPAH